MHILFEPVAQKIFFSICEDPSLLYLEGVSVSIQLQFFFFQCGSSLAVTFLRRLGLANLLFRPSLFFLEPSLPKNPFCVVPLVLPMICGSLVYFGRRNDLISVDVPFPLWIPSLADFTSPSPFLLRFLFQGFALISTEVTNLSRGTLSSSTVNFPLPGQLVESSLTPFFSSFFSFFPVFFLIEIPYIMSRNRFLSGNFCPFFMYISSLCSLFC